MHFMQKSPLYAQKNLFAYLPSPTDWFAKLKFQFLLGVQAILFSEDTSFAKKAPHNVDLAVQLLLID